MSEVFHGIPEREMRKSTISQEQVKQSNQGANKSESLQEVADRLFREADPNQRESMLALQELLEANFALRGIEAGINALAELGDKRTQKEERELNRLIVWYRIYRQLYRDAEKRMYEADEQLFNKPNRGTARQVREERRERFFSTFSPQPQKTWHSQSPDAPRRNNNREGNP